MCVQSHRDVAWCMVGTHGMHTCKNTRGGICARPYSNPGWAQSLISQVYPYHWGLWELPLPVFLCLEQLWPSCRKGGWWKGLVQAWAVTMGSLQSGQRSCHCQKMVRFTLRELPKAEKFPSCLTHHWNSVYIYRRLTCSSRWAKSHLALSLYLSSPPGCGLPHSGPSILSGGEDHPGVTQDKWPHCRQQQEPSRKGCSPLPVRGGR